MDMVQAHGRLPPAVCRQPGANAGGCANESSVDPAAAVKQMQTAHRLAAGRRISAQAESRSIAAIRPQMGGEATLWSSGGPVCHAARRCQVQRFNRKGASRARGFFGDQPAGRFVCPFRGAHAVIR